LATDRLRAVLDTNVIVAACRSRNPRSPTVELLQLWTDGAFDLLYSAGLKAKYEEKLMVRHVDPARARRFLAQLPQHGIHVSVPSVTRVIEADLDDDVVLACAVAGQATHLVTYDLHFASLGDSYRNIRLIDGLHFLYLVRGDKPPV
jgi:predicted nucleic acid-binding protein